uniref:uncharacterized protein PAM68-like n=1 Tax=Erigeron canadensis TaxID=72917 RepID=UPI001CB9C5B6|nr:uncharacterized protein PAM68-like [Erigeron canadensis]
MKSLCNIELTSQYIISSSKSSAPLLLPKPVKNPSYVPSKTWKIHAKAKGFNRPNLDKQNSMTNVEKRKKQEEADDKIPDVVMGRMITRILFNVGVPLVTGLGLLQMFSVIRDNNLMQIPRWLPFLTTFITLGASTLGIAYGTLSTSWDADNKGSLLGLEEAKKNWVEMWAQDDSENS